MSQIKLPLTPEITSYAGYDTVVSNELTHPYPPPAPRRVGCFKGYSGFRLVPRDLCVGPVPYLLHSTLSKEIRPSQCARLVSSPAPGAPGFPGRHRPGPASSSPLPKLLAPHGVLSLPPSLRFPVLLHASLVPFPMISHPSAHLPCFPDLLSLPSFPWFFFFWSSFSSHIFPLPQDSLFPISPIPSHLPCF